MNLSTTAKAYIRLAVAGIAFLNLMLTTSFGWKPLPYTEDQVYNALSILFMVATTLWTWFKDSPVTTYGKAKNKAGKEAVGDRKTFNETLTNAENTAKTEEITKIEETNEAKDASDKKE